MPYNKQGQPISEIEWAILRGKPGYRIINRTKVKNIIISTVWTGHDIFDYDNFINGNKKLLIFETLAFNCIDKGMTNELDRMAYATEKEAIIGHRKMTRHFREIQTEEKIKRWKKNYIK